MADEIGKKSIWNELLTKARHGDQPAMSELCTRIKDKLDLIARYRMRKVHPDEINEIVQQTLAVFAEKLNQVQDNPHLFALQIMHHKLGHYYTARSRKGPGSEEDRSAGMVAQSESDTADTDITDASTDIHAEVEARDLQQRVLGALLTLKPFCRTLFLGLLKGFSTRELWEYFQPREPSMNRGAYDKRVLDCRKRLRSMLEEGT